MPRPCKKYLLRQRKKSLAYIIGIMNMILHGIEAPNVCIPIRWRRTWPIFRNATATTWCWLIPPLAARSGGGAAEFSIKTGETAFLFLQAFLLRSSRRARRGGVVIKNTFLSNTDNPSVSCVSLLLESCTLAYGGWTCRAGVPGRGD